MNAQAAVPEVERVGGIHDASMQLSSGSRPPYGPRHIQRRGHYNNYFTKRCQIAVVAAAWFML